MYRTVFWTLWEKARVGCFKRTTLKHVYYLGWNRSPARLDAWDKRSGMVHWEDPEGSGGEGGGRGDRDGEHMWIHGWFISMYDKTHYNKKKRKKILLYIFYQFAQLKKIFYPIKFPSYNYYSLWLVLEHVYMFISRQLYFCEVLKFSEI